MRRGSRAAEVSEPSACYRLVVRHLIAPLLQEWERLLTESEEMQARY